MTQASCIGFKHFVGAVCFKILQIRLHFPKLPWLLIPGLCFCWTFTNLSQSKERYFLAFHGQFFLDFFNLLSHFNKFHIFIAWWRERSAWGKAGEKPRLRDQKFSNWIARLARPSIPQCRSGSWINRVGKNWIRGLREQENTGEREKNDIFPFFFSTTKPTFTLAAFLLKNINMSFQGLLGFDASTKVIQDLVPDNHALICHHFASLIKSQRIVLSAEGYHSILKFVGVFF